MEQRTPEWFAARKGKITGSRVGAILGHNPHSTREDVMREMVRDHFGAKREFEGNDATRWGEEHEPYAKAWYEKHTGRTVDTTGFVVHEQYPFLAASPDGLVGMHEGVEFKCPFYARKPYSVFSSKKRHYYDQCQLVMAVCGLKAMDFVVWLNDNLATVERVDIDPDWIVSSMPALREFIDEYESIIKDPARAKPYLATKKEPAKEYAFVESLEMDRLWLLTQKLERLDAERAPIAEEHKALREQLFGRHGYATNGMLRLSCVERKGGVDYDRLFSDLGINEIIRQRGIDLDSYRRPANFAYKVELIKE